jgi:hypothetical protein
MFVLFLLSLSFQIESRLNDSGHDHPVFTSSQIAIVTSLAISLHCIDACCDCLLQERKAHAQITRKITSVAGSCVSVALLLLSDEFCLLPVIFFACCIFLLGLVVSACWWFLPQNTEVAFRAMKKRSTTTFLSTSHIVVVVFAALIGDSADQILDAISNIQIDAFVSGGKVKYEQCSYSLCIIVIRKHRAAVAKEVISMFASSSSAYLYLRVNSFGSISSFHRFSLKICLIWSALQFLRFGIYHATLWDKFSENISVVLIAFITLSEKVAGGVFGFSRTQVEADWLVSVSARALPGKKTSMIFSPVFWMSASELINNVVGNGIKLFVDAADPTHKHTFIIVALVFFVCCAMSLQVYMIQGIQGSKSD